MNVYLIYFSIASPVLPMLIFLIKRPFGELYLRWLFLLLIVSITIDSSIVFTGWNLNSGLLSNAYFLILFLIFSIIYHTLWRTIFDVRRNIITTLAIIIVVLFIADSLFFESIFQIQSLLIGVESIILVVYACQFYLSLYSGIILGLDLKKFPAFWINSAVLFYFVFNLFLFAIPSYLFSSHPEMAGDFFVLHRAINIVKNVLLAVGVYYSTRKIVSITRL